MVQRDQWDTYRGPKKVTSCFAVRRGRGHRAAAPVESCQSLPKRSPWGRLGSALYTCNRLHRIRRRFKRSRPNSLSSPRGFSNIRPILLPGPSESPRLLQRWRACTGKTLAARSRGSWCYCSHAALPFHLFGCKHQPCARFECSDQLRRVVLVFLKLPMLSMLSLLVLGA